MPNADSDIENATAFDFNTVGPSVMTAIGELLDEAFKTSHGTPLFTGGATALDIYSRASDADGLTLRDAAAVTLGYISASVAGIAVGALSKNPYASITVSAATGSATATFIDSLQVNPELR